MKVANVFISCLLFHVLWGSKLLNGCSVVWSSNICLPGMQNKIKINIYNDWFKVFSIMLLRQLNFGVLWGWQLITFTAKGKLSTFLYLQFLLLLSETGLDPESCLAIFHPGLFAYKLVAYKSKQLWVKSFIR